MVTGYIVYLLIYSGNLLLPFLELHINTAVVNIPSDTNLRQEYTSINKQHQKVLRSQKLSTNSYIFLAQISAE